MKELFYNLKINYTPNIDFDNQFFENLFDILLNSNFDFTKLSIGNKLICDLTYKDLSSLLYEESHLSSIYSILDTLLDEMPVLLSDEFISYLFGNKYNSFTVESVEAEEAKVKSEENLFNSINSALEDKITELNNKFEYVQKNKPFLNLNLKKKGCALAFEMLIKIKCLTYMSCRQCLILAQCFSLYYFDSNSPKNHDISKQDSNFFTYLTYEEFYYALNFLDDVDIRNLLSEFEDINFDDLYKFYITKNKNSFIKALRVSNYYNKHLYIYLYLFSNNEFKIQFLGLSLKSNEKEIEEEKHRTSYILPNFSKLSMLINKLLKNIPKDINKSLKIWNDISKIEPFALAECKYYCSYKLNQGYLSNNYKMQEYNKCIEVIFKNVDESLCPKTIIDDIFSYESLRIKEANNFILNIIHEKMNENIGQKNTDKNEIDFTKVNNADERIIGRSSLIIHILNKSNITDTDEFYRKILEILYKYLSGELVTDKIELKHQKKYINTLKNKNSKIDFIYILGGRLIKNEKQSTNPKIYWNEDITSMVAFFYAYGGYPLLNEKSKIDPNPNRKGLFSYINTINGEKENYSTNAGHIQDELFESWSKIIIRLCEIVTSATYDIEKLRNIEK